MLWLITAVILGGFILWVRRERRVFIRQIAELTSEINDLQTKQKIDNERLVSLCDVAGQFVGDFGLEESLTTGLEAIWQLPAIDAVAILLGENELGPFHYKGIRGVDNPFAFIDQQCPLPLWGVLAHALVHRPKPGDLDCLAINDIRAEGVPLPEEFPWLPPQGSLLVNPLRGRGKTIGAVILYSKKENAFQDLGQRRFLFSLVSYVSRALHESRTYDQSMRWVRHLVSLQSLTRSLHRADSLRTVQAALWEEARDLFGPIAVHFYLPTDKPAPSDPAGLTLFAGPHISPQEEAFTRSPHLHQLLAWVLEAEQPLFVKPQASFLQPGDLYYQESGRGVLVPILETDEQAGGVLLFALPEEARPFDENDLIVIRTIANSASVVIGSRRWGASPQSTPA
ncbi:MAG: GAF domain-containing protein [Caldilineaceae bacterium]|nr:GAF domain-containing protein [Caldilineaceae bacterium]